MLKNENNNMAILKKCEIECLKKSKENVARGLSFEKARPI